MNRRKLLSEREERRLLRKREKWLDARFGIYIDPIGIFHPSVEGPNGMSVQCGRCRQEFWMASGLFMGSSSPDLELTCRAGPCPDCYLSEGVVAWGAPELPRGERGGWSVAGVSDRVVERSLKLLFDHLRLIVEDLQTGAMDVPDAVQVLRESGGPMSRVADWLESRNASVTVACTLLTGVLTVLGPALVSSGQDDGFDEDRMSELIDEVLEKHNRNQGPSTDFRESDPPAVPPRPQR